MSENLLVFVQCGSLEEAERLTRSLVSQRLAACASVGAPVRSTYWWQGAIETAEEVPVVIKSSRELWTRLEAAIRELHSYEVPEIVAVRMEGISEPYRQWLNASLNS